MQQTNRTKRMVETALLIAIGVILSLIIIFHLPYGGSITLCSMLPLVIVSQRHGCRWGLFAGLVFGLLQMFLGAAEGVFKGADLLSVVGVTVLDYLAAYAVIGLSGMLCGRIPKPAVALGLGTLCACVLRFCIHVLSGYIFFRSYAEWFFSQEGFAFGATVLSRYSGNLLGFIYSVVYNALFMVPETALTVAAAVLVCGVLQRTEKN